MLDISKSVFVYFIFNCITIVALAFIRELPTDDIIININKAYALQRMGAYSTNMVEQVVHTFLSLDNFCGVQTTDAVCRYTSSSTKTNIMKLATMIPSSRVRDTSFGYDRKKVSQLIGNDLSRILTQHKPDEFLRNTESSVHFINNQFYSQKSADKLSTSTPTINTVDNYHDILRFRPTSVDLIIKQINSNRISFEHLSLADLKVFLTSVLSNIDNSYKVNDVEESLNTFSQIIIGQSVYALRYCGLSQQYSLSSKPCLAVSTLFLQIPSNSPSIYSIYRLLPLPIVANGNKHIYSDLAKIIGINSIEKTLIMWNNELDSNECTFTPIVLCHNPSILISLSEPSCLSQLLDDQQSVINMCEVRRSHHIEQAVLRINDGVWLFYNTNQTYDCQVYSDVNQLTETMLIDAPAIVRIPCHKTIICPGFQLPTASCKTNRIALIPGFQFNIQNLPQFVLPIKNITQMLQSAHHIQIEQLTKELTPTFSLKKSTFDEIIYDYGNYLLYIMCCIFVMLFVDLFKLVRFKIKRKLNKQDEQIQDILNF